MFPMPTNDATMEKPPGRRRTPALQPVKRDVDPDFVVNSCLTLSAAFGGIYAGNANGLNFETLYRCAHAVVEARHGEVLYTLVATTMAAEVDKLAASLDGSASVQDAEFLRELLSRWKTHSKAILMINDVVMYMDRKYVMETRKARVRELGLRAWREGLLRRSPGDVLPRLRAALLAVAARERAGEAVDVALCDLMAGASKMLVESGDGLYEEVLETPFLDETRRFYAGELVRLLASPCGCGEYLRIVESLMDAEKARVSRCLQARAEVGTYVSARTRTEDKVVAVLMAEMVEKVEAVVLTEMVEKNAALMVGMQGSGLASMLVDGRYWDLTRMHRLLGRFQGGVPAMRDAMEAHFRDIRNTVGDDDRLLSCEKERYRKLIDGVFGGELSFHAALDSCLT